MKGETVLEGLKPNYDKSPVIHVHGHENSCTSGWAPIIDRLRESFDSHVGSCVLECYHGIDEEEVLTQLQNLRNCEIFKVSEAYKDPDAIETMVYPDVTDDRIFGRLTHLTISDYFDGDRLVALRKKIGDCTEKNQIIFGTGALYVSAYHDCLIYADMPRWEIQLRMRSNQVYNLGVRNKNDEFSQKFKQGYFVDWRICDRVKVDVLPQIDFLLDTTKAGRPKLVPGDALRDGLDQAVKQPFRLVPFFDPGPWGGQWMKEVCDLDRSKENFAWCFDCVPEENSLQLQFGNEVVEIPSLDLLFYRSEALLGIELYQLIGPEFPIRFDFLDTMEGGNLSLQVHPTIAYIREHFGITYTQDESYYLLDAAEDAEVYLGLKEDIKPSQMIEELKEAQNEGQLFDARKFVETWNVKKHDHVLIPAGTVHCSGKNSMVLEISATPYIFTFKLWDWARLGLDGKPRPINIARGEQVIDWSRTTSWTKKNLVNKFEPLQEGDGWREERTGLHETEFIETRRHWFNGLVSHDTEDLVNVLNLVEGREIIIESPSGAFEPYVIHYAETFIIPASVGRYTIRPYGESKGKTCATIKAFVRLDKLKALGEDLWMILPKDQQTSKT